MYLYQPCLLILALHIWAFEPYNGRGGWLRPFIPVALLMISEVELSFTYLSLYPAAMLLPLPLIHLRSRSSAWAEVLTASLLGGFLCWKMMDAWPLVPGVNLLSSTLLLIPTALLCRSREDRPLACALGGLIFELFFCLREYTLFSFCVIRLGSRQSLALTSTALCLLTFLDPLGRSVMQRVKRTFST